MNNPYEILGLKQNATRQEIKKAQIKAMKLRKYPLQKISLASKQLMNPAKRLVADFMFPTRIKAKRPKLIKFEVPFEEIDISSISGDEFNTI